MLEIINQRYMYFLFEVAKKPRNISELAKAGDLTSSVASSVISRWQREGVVNKERVEGRGQDVIVNLTEYGLLQIKLLKQLRKNHQENKALKLSEELNAEEVQNGTKKS